ncbi:lipopolysaccharide transport periplasmic protein LptA [Caldichromatium japonicum]|nr:lipopolysaccharide transport periplasmic protein LptA [Caldichromatium japonicum]
MALLAGLFAVCSRPQALEADAQQPILIEADEVEVRETDNTSIYVGHVQVEQGSMHLRADHVTVYHRPDRQPRLIIAIGQPASYRQLLDGEQGDVQAFARRMEYDADKDELTLIGDGLLIQGEDRLTGERIIYERAKARFRAGGSGRVRIRLTPDQR